MRCMIVRINANACAAKHGKSHGRETGAECWSCVDQKKIAGRNVNGKEGSILKHPE
jgi:hypothetical protein